MSFDQISNKELKAKLGKVLKEKVPSGTESFTFCHMCDVNKCVHLAEQIVAATHGKDRGTEKELAYSLVLNIGHLKEALKLSSLEHDCRNPDEILEPQSCLKVVASSMVNRLPDTGITSVLQGTIESETARMAACDLKVVISVVRDAVISLGSNTDHREALQERIELNINQVLYLAAIVLDKAGDTTPTKETAHPKEQAICKSKTST